ncbi:LamG-like jellyroll fold domain-containing protein [Microbispora catharanthi]|uniref:LamG-like jellyroll fold domain-containing protein n=1 Tax=Microbispora catharanthi TaxID=1712871 RepID=UPI00111A2766|nr:LamG-like jellyroll fold domain-containing protein [Microbispora catharanthi]
MDGVRRSGFGLGKIGPARWLLRVTTVSVIAILPGTLQLPAFPAPVSAPRVVLNLPNVTSGSADAPPVQQSGSAQGLPHLVDASATEPRDLRIPGPRPSDDGKRPEGGLPLDKPRTPSDEPAKGGLKSPPPLPAEFREAKPEETAPPQAVQSQGLSMRQVRPAKGAAAESPTLVVTRVASAATSTRWSSNLASAMAEGDAPSVSSLSALGTQGSDGWTLSSLTPYFQAKVTDPLYRSSYLGYEIEHDPSVPAQGSGLISSGKGTTSASSGSFASVSVPSGKLTDGWLVRWRVRGVTTSGVEGAWSDWQPAKIDVFKPAVSDLSAWPEAGVSTLASLTPEFSAKVTDPMPFRYSYLSAEVEHDPSTPGQGSGLIWSGTGTTATSSTSSYASVTMPKGKLTDGWMVRWRVRAVTTTGVAGPWSDWQSAKVDIFKPTVSNLSADGTQGSGLWTLWSLTPRFDADISDWVSSRYSYLSAEVEHDPSVPGQGSGLIWSGTGTTPTSSSTSSAYVKVPAGKLTDGWMVRWRVRAVTTTGLNGPWSDWQTSKIDITKPAVSEVTTTTGLPNSGLWTSWTLTPEFRAKIRPTTFGSLDANSYLAAEVEHDPSTPGQGSGLIWSGKGTTTTSADNPYASVTVPSGKLSDDWVVRWRVRGVTTKGLAGPWSDWQTMRVDVTKPVVSDIGVQGSQSGGLWTMWTLSQSFSAKITYNSILGLGPNAYLGAEIEHDPSVPNQGSGLIWSGTGTTATSSSSSYASVSMPAGKLTDGWLVRWRVRGVTTTGINGPWSEWQTAKIDVNKPAGTGLGVVPGTKTADDFWVLASSTPWLYTKVTTEGGLASYLGAEVEHDPSVPDQGSGLIWSGTGTKSYASGSNAWVQVPADKLSDGWLVRWRVRGVTTTGVTGPWSEWQSARVSVNRPAVAAVGITPGTAGVWSWTAQSLTPWLFAKVTDAQGRSSYLGVEVEHDPEAADQGSGQIWAGTGTAAYPSGSNAWTVIPAGKLTDGWRIRWRVRGVTMSGVNGPWSEWQRATVAGLPFQTFSPADNSQVSTLRPTLSAHAQSPVEAKVTYWFQICSGTKDHWTWCESSYDWSKNGTFTVPKDKLQWGKTYWWYAKAATSTVTVTSPWMSFTTTPEQGTVNSLLVTGTEGREFNYVNGDYTRSVTDLSVATPGPPLAVTRSYNSLDPRSDGAFGSGWSTRWDMRIQDEGQAISYPSMVGHWRLGDLLGSVFAADASGRRFNAALSAGTSPVQGKIGGAIATSGGAVATAPGPVLRTDDSYTVASWLRLDDRSGSYQVARQNGDNGAPYYLGVDQATGQLKFATYASDTAGSTSTSVLSGVNAPVGQWFHVAGVYDKAAGSISLYLNGDLMKTATGVPAGWNATGTTVLGSDVKGAIDDLRMFQKALSSAEIQGLAAIKTITPPATVLITYPDGTQQRFASKGDGTYASPPGTFATLVSLDDGGWRLMDRSATSYWFDTSGRLTKVSDRRDRTQDLAYGTDGKLLKVTATGGRSLTFGWTGAHVTSVATDPVDGAPISWTYEYDGDKLVKVCPPAAGGACTTYTYTDASHYRSVVLDSMPTGYWRLGGTATALRSKVPSSGGLDFGASDGMLRGTTANATAGVTGALAGTADTAMTFAGTAGSAYVSLPEATVSGLGGSLSVEAWFKTTGSGTILGYQNSYEDDPDSYGLGIYVGTDGKLRGQFWNGTIAPITTPGKVNDGNWHHVVLSGAEDIQTLFLDGQPVGGVAGKITHTVSSEMWDTRIGAGYGGPSWPFTTASFTAFPFAGSIDEVAVYNRPLGLGTVRTHYAARLAQPLLTKETQPSGRVHAENTYNADGGRLTTHTDDDGGIWKLSDLVYAKESTTQISATATVTDPHNGTLTYVTNALRGYQVVSTTDQLGKTTRYAYDVGGFPAKVTDPNGNATDVSYNARGNPVAKKTCRSSDTCFTEYYSYYLNADDPFDPRNDQPTAYRDGRSASAADDTYAVTMTYNTHGEPTKKTVPATSDFPQGRSQITAYTDGTEPAVGGGTTPAGLVKSAKDFKGNETTYAYTANGDLAQETGPSGLIKKYGYDPIGRMVERSDISQANPEGVTTEFTYSRRGLLTTVTGAAVRNEVADVTHTLRQSFTYDADGNQLSVSVSDLTGGDAERTTAHTYDSYGRVDSVTGPEGGVERYEYDHKGQKVSYTDTRGSVYNYTYTPREELATVILRGWRGSPVDPQSATDVVMESYAYDPAGRRAAKTDAMGRISSYTYYADGLPAQTIASGVSLNGSSSERDVILDERVYDPAGHLTRQITDGGVLRVDAVYDEAGRLTSHTTDPAALARKTAYRYDANDNIIEIGRSAAGTDRTEVTEYAYDAADQPIRQVVHNNGQDLVTTLTVDDRGLITAITDPRGNVSGATAADYTTDIRYDVAGNRVEVKLPQVQIERYGIAAAPARPTTWVGYNTFGDQTHLLDPEGQKVVSAFDRAGRMVSQTMPAYTPPGGQTITPMVTAEYDLAGQQVSATDARGHTTTALYDGLGRKVRVTNPSVGGAAGGITTYGYDLLGEAISQTDPTGARWEATYDDLGRQITTTTFERRPTVAAYVTRLEYDDAGNLTKVTRPGGDVANRAYNAAGEMTSHTDGLGNSTTFGYDLTGRVAKTTNPLGVSTTAGFDQAGRQIEAADIDADGTVLRARTFGYDAAGNQISQTTASGHTTTRVYDAANRIVEQHEPVSATETINTSFGYDASGRQTRSTDGRGNSTYATYNSLGLVESVIEPITTAHPNVPDRTWTTIYDEAGNQITSLLPGGVKVERTFDELNRLVKQTGSGGEAATEDKHFTYDLAGRLTSADELAFSLNDRGLLLKSSGPDGDISAYAYDADNRLVQRVDATGMASFTWDDADRLTGMTDPVTSSAIEYGYDKAARVTSMVYGANGTRRSFSYDALNRLTKDELKSGQDSPIASIDYGYDADNNMTSKATTGTAGAGNNTYTYDWANRLTSWIAPDGKTTDYGWDAAGNRIRAGDKTYTYDERNRLISGDGYTYTYTARGTLAEASNGKVEITKFDAFDRLVQDGAVTYDYDALDRMATRSDGEQTLKFAYDGQTNNLVGVTDSGNVKKAAYGRDAFGRTVSLSDGGGGQLAFSDLHGDLIGAFTADGTALIDSVAYNPFGEVIAQTGAPHGIGYQGGYTDPSTKKVNMAARWYQPATGSFVSRDTATLTADPSVQLNRYTYANDNPLTNTDPDGHKAKTATVSGGLAKVKTKTKTVTVQPATSCAKKKGKEKQTCLVETEVKQDHKRCVKDYGQGGCSWAENEYRDCRAEHSKKYCAATKDVYGDCLAIGYGNKTCQYGVSAYAECRGVHIDADICRDTASVAIKCRAGGYGKRTCDDTTVAYRTCLNGRKTNMSEGRSVCGDNESHYRQCRTERDADMCNSWSSNYLACRDQAKMHDDKSCTSFAETYFQCRSSKKYGAHNDPFCGEMMSGLLGCWKENKPGACWWYDDMYLECAKKNKSERACMQGNGMTGKVCDKKNKNCVYHLDNGLTNLVTTAAAVGGAFILAACGVAGVHLITFICEAGAAVIEFGAWKLSTKNKGKGVWIKVGDPQIIWDWSGVPIPAPGDITVGSQ